MKTIAELEKQKYNAIHLKEGICKGIREPLRLRVTDDHTHSLYLLKFGKKKVRVVFRSLKDNVTNFVTITRDQWPTVIEAVLDRFFLYDVLTSGQILEIPFKFLGVLMDHEVIWKPIPESVDSRMLESQYMLIIGTAMWNKALEVPSLQCRDEYASHVVTQLALAQASTHPTAIVITDQTNKDLYLMMVEKGTYALVSADLSDIHVFQENYLPLVLHALHASFEKAPERLVADHRDKLILDVLENN